MGVKIFFLYVGQHIEILKVRMQVCWYHALSNEKEEMMGVLIGEKRGTGVHFSTLKAIKRMTKQKDRVEIDDSQLVAASTFAASLQATPHTAFHSRDGILERHFSVEVSGHKLESSHTRVFVWFSTLIFPFYKMLFMKNSCLADFFVRIFKTR